MKKIVVLVFLSILLMTNIAYAEPIKFLNLEWGATFYDFLNALLSNGMDGQTPCDYKTEDCFSLASYETHNQTAYGDTYTELYTMTVTLYNQGNEVWEIGGQSVYKITGTFVPGTVVKDDGMTYYPGDYRYARLVRVELELGKREAHSFGSTYVGFDMLNDVFNDMKAKLRAVYGENYVLDYSASGKTELLTWSQDNGWVELERIDGKVSSNGITVQGVHTNLTYGFNDVSFISNIWKDYHKDDLKGL